MNPTKNFLVEDITLLYGKPILVPDSGFSIVPKKIGDIANIGEATFFSYLNTIISDIPEAIEKELLDIPEEERYYFFLLVSLKNSMEFRFAYETALCFFIELLVTYDTEEHTLFYFLDEEKLIVTPDILEKVRYILKKQYNIPVQAETEKPSDEHAKSILDKMKKSREKVNKAKEQDAKVSITFADIISAVSVQISGLNIFNIWNLTYYAFYNQFHRLKMVEDYDVGLKSIMAGADSKKIKLKHWVEPIQTKQE